MATNIQGSFHAPLAFTVRMTTGSSSADWTITAGTTYQTAEDALVAWNAVISSISCSVFLVDTAINSPHTKSVRVQAAGSFSVEWSHLGDGSRLRNFLGETGDISTQPSGYVFTNPLAAAWFPPYDLRRFDISGEPWSTQRLMTGAGSVVPNNPHFSKGGDLMYQATAQLWFGNTSGYAGYEALRDLIEGILEYGQPFTITTDDNIYRCRLPAGESFEMIPEPVEDVVRGYIYRAEMPVIMVS